MTTSWTSPLFATPLSSKEERVPIHQQQHSGSAASIGSSITTAISDSSTTLSSGEGIQTSYATFSTAGSSASDEPPLYPTKRRSKRTSWSTRVCSARPSLVLLGVTLLLGLVFYHATSNGFFSTRKSAPGLPQWSWDHFHYAPTRSADATAQQPRPHEVLIAPDGQTTMTSFHNLLIAQVATSSTSKAAEITSRPNRAYAKQWGLDYVLHHHPEELSGDAVMDDEQCAIRRVLLQLVSSSSSQSHNVNSTATRSSVLSYDAVLLLPSRAIITNMDYDLMSLFPQDKLFGITELIHDARSSGNSVPDASSSAARSLLFWNLHHEESETMARTLLHEQGPRTMNDSCNLVAAALLESSSSHHSNEPSMVASIAMTPDGFVEPRLIQLQQSSIMTSSRSTMSEVDLATLQTTADSVCYRFYPKCEVL